MYFVFSAPSSGSRARAALACCGRIAFTAAIAALAVSSSPAFAQAPAATLESVRVPADGRAVRLKTSLDAGELFLLKATGAVKVGAQMVDAEYGGFDAAAPGKDVMGGMDVGVDVGIPAQNASSAASPGRSHWFGSYRPDHTYYMIINGAGRPLTLRLLTGGGKAGPGAIRVSVFRLSPAPTPLFPLLETLQVPVLDRIVATASTTRLSAIYLIQASGSGRVGGGGLGQGDAEYMDYNADGTGAVDVGDRNTDYGLGVDEADQSRSPRLHKWGPWRKDHTYYTLFEGTGHPIHFFFYDVQGGYGDNSTTDTLTVKVFPAP